MTDFPTLYILQVVKSVPFHVPEVWKRYPVRAEAPRISHRREYLPPRGETQNPGKAADISRCHHCFPREMTSEERLQKFHSDDLSSPAPGWGFWLDEAIFQPIRITTQVLLLTCHQLRRHFAGKPVVTSWLSGWRNSCLRGQMGQMVRG